MRADLITLIPRLSLTLSIAIARAIFFHASKTDLGLNNGGAALQRPYGPNNYLIGALVRNRASMEPRFIVTPWRNGEELLQLRRDLYGKGDGEKRDRRQQAVNKVI